MSDGDFLPTLSIILTVVVATGTMSYWLSRQFTDVRNLVFNKTEQLQRFFMDRISEHEKEDNKRFSDLDDDMWLLKVRLAADGVNGKKDKHVSVRK